MEEDDDDDLFSQTVRLKTAKSNEHSFVPVQHGVLYVRVILAGDLNLPQKHCCTTPNIFI